MMIAIHIGASKAGSTTIQKFLGANSDLLRQIGVDYPRIGQGNRGSHVNLFYDLRGHRNFKPQLGTIKQLVDHLETSDCNLTVLSAEEFQRCKPPEVAAIRERFGVLAENIQIRLIIRELIDLMPSTYSQETKVGENTLDFDSFFQSCVRKRGKAFVETARAWGDAFGWDRLRVSILDRRLLLNGDLIDDFLAGVGIDQGGCVFKRSETTNVANASPGWRVLEAVRALFSGGHGLPADHPLNQSYALDKDKRKLIGRIARQLGDELDWNVDRGRYLSRAQADQCVKIHGKSIAALNERLPVSLPPPLDLAGRGFVEREFMPEAGQIPGRKLRKFYDELATRTTRKRSAAVPALDTTGGDS